MVINKSGIYWKLYGSVWSFYTYNVIWFENKHCHLNPTIEEKCNIEIQSHFLDFWQYLFLNVAVAILFVYVLQKVLERRYFSHTKPFPYLEFKMVGFVSFYMLIHAHHSPSSTSFNTYQISKLLLELTKQLPRFVGTNLERIMSWHLLVLLEQQCKQR